MAIDMIIISPPVLFDLDKTVEIYPSMIVVKANIPCYSKA
jgi:hypothetical protein